VVDDGKIGFDNIILHLIGTYIGLKSLKDTINQANNKQSCGCVQLQKFLVRNFSHHPTLKSSYQEFESVSSQFDSEKDGKINS
jgi:hypothetical protein